jgi:hypothetical protein
MIGFQGEKSAEELGECGVSGIGGPSSYIRQGYLLVSIETRTRGQNLNLSSGMAEPYSNKQIQMPEGSFSYQSVENIQVMVCIVFQLAP